MHVTDQPGSLDGRSSAAQLIEHATEELDQFRREGDTDRLDSSITHLRTAVELADLGAPEHAWALGVLAQGLMDRFEATAQRADIEEAVRLATDVVVATDVDDPSRPRRLQVSASAHGLRYQALGDSSDSEHNLTLAAAGLAACRDPDERPLHRSALAGAYSRRFQMHGNLDDLELCIAEITQAVAESAADPVLHATCLDNLSIALRSRFDHAGVPGDLDAAVVAAREAVRACPSGDSQEMGLLSRLGGALTMRYERYGQLTDLDEAIELGRRAVGHGAGSRRSRWSAIRPSGRPRASVRTHRHPDRHRRGSLTPP